MALRLMINGAINDFPELTEGMLLPTLLHAMGLKADRVAVEQNGTLVRRALWQETCLREDDKLEIVHFVGGGSAAGK